MNKLHLCRPLIRAIDQSNLKDHFARAQLVTYNFYVGKKHMFDSEYRLAEESLSFAFLKCHKASKRNKKLILIYLIPVKMLLGMLGLKVVENVIKDQLNPLYAMFKNDKDVQECLDNGADQNQSGLDGMITNGDKRNKPADLDENLKFKTNSKNKNDLDKKPVENQTCMFS